MPRYLIEPAIPLASSYPIPSPMTGSWAPRLKAPDSQPPICPPESWPSQSFIKWSLSLGWHRTKVLSGFKEWWWLTVRINISFPIDSDCPSRTPGQQLSFRFGKLRFKGKCSLTLCVLYATPIIFGLWSFTFPSVHVNWCQSLHDEGRRIYQTSWQHIGRGSGIVMCS